MATPVETVEGETAAKDFQLKEDGVALNITGMTVTLLLRRMDGTLIDMTSKVTVIDATLGKVRYAPAAADLASAQHPYSYHWKVTDGAGKIAFFPSGAADGWAVYPP